MLYRRMIGEEAVSAAARSAPPGPADPGPAGRDLGSTRLANRHAAYGNTNPATKGSGRSANSFIQSSSVSVLRNQRKAGGAVCSRLRGRRSSPKDRVATFSASMASSAIREGFRKNGTSRYNAPRTSTSTIARLVQERSVGVGGGAPVTPMKIPLGMTGTVLILTCFGSLPGGRSLARQLGRQRQKIAFRVVAEGHPEVVRPQRRDHMWAVLELDPLPRELGVCGPDVGDLVVEDRPGVVKLGFFGLPEHEANPAAVEEGEAGRFEEQAESERVAVERRRTFQVVDVDRDLGDAVERRPSLELFSYAGTC